MTKMLTSLLLSFFLVVTALSPGVNAEEPSIYVKPPLLDIVNIRLNPETPSPSENFRVSFTVNNHGSVDARDVIIELDGMSNFKVVGLTNRQFRNSLSFNTSNYIRFDLQAEKDRKGNELTLNFSYNYPGGSGSQQITVKLPLPEVDSDLYPPNISVSKVSLNPETPRPNQTFNATVYFNNFSDTEAKNVNIEIDGQDNFEVKDVSSLKHLKSITRDGSDNCISFNLKNLEDRKGSSIKLNLSYYYGEEAKTEQQSLLVNLPLDTGKDSQARPILQISSFSVNPTGRDNEHRLKLILENLEQERAENVYITLDGGNFIYAAQGSNVKYLPAIEGSKKIEVEYLLGVNPTDETNYYPLSFTLEYEDDVGNTYNSTETLGLNADDIDASVSAGKPWVIISKYSLSEEKILAGNIVTLDLFIENTNSRPVQNIKVSFDVIQVERSSGEGTDPGGTVFSPVDSSNSFFIPRIPAMTTIEKSVDLYVDPNAAAKTYIVPITIEYEDEKAGSHSVSDMINIPVTQECKFQILSIDVPPAAYVGQPAFIGAEFVNVGKVDLNNFMVMLEGNFRKEQASYFVGNLQIGSSDFYQGIIYPEKEGEISGNLIFSYIDNNNREVQVVEPFALEVQPMMPMEEFPGDMPPDHHDRQGGFSGIINSYGLIILLAIAALAFGIFFWRKRIKKKNEEFIDA